MNQNTPTLSLAQKFAANGVAMMLLSAFLFAASSLLLKYAGSMQGVSVWTLTAMRFLIGIVFAFWIFRGSGRMNIVPILTDPLLILRGIIGGSGVILFNMCILEIGAGRTLIIVTSYPIFATLMAPLLLPEPISWRSIFFGTGAICGIGLMMGVGEFSASAGIYDAMAVVVALMSGFVIVLIRKLHTRRNTSTIFAAQCFYGLVFCLPGLAINFEALGWREAGVAFASAVIVAFAQMSMTHGFKHISVSKGSSIHLLTPLLVAGLAALLLGESFQAMDLLGAGLILFSCFQVIRNKGD